MFGAVHVIFTSAPVINSQMPEGEPSQSGRQGKELCVCVVDVTLVCYSWDDAPVSDFNQFGSSLMLQLLWTNGTSCMFEVLTQCTVCSLWMT